MRELERSVARVFRRLRMQRFLNAFFWIQVLGLGVLAVVLGAEKLAGRALLPPPVWAPYAAWQAVGVAAGFLWALGGPSKLDAASAIDHAYALEERISSALALPADLRQTPAGKALIADAVRSIEKVDVVAEFGFRPPRRAWLILIPATALGLVLLAPAVAPKLGQAHANPSPANTRQFAQHTLALKKRIASQAQNIDKQTYPETAKLLSSVLKKAEELAKAPPAAKDKLMVELNKLSDALKDRQKQLGSAEQSKRQLQRLKEMAGEGPAEQIARDLVRGDFQQAAERIAKLQEQLRSGKLTPAEKQKLQNQLGEMARKLAAMANMEERKNQLEDARRNGGLTQQQYEREMQKLADQAKGLQKLNQLANQLSQAHDALKKGDNQKAAESLGMTRIELEDLASNLKELESLDSAMTEIQEAKDGLSAEGMNQLGEGMNSIGNGFSNRRGLGNGMGRGRGAGDRPEAESETATYTTRVPQQLKKGKAVATGFTKPSKNIKGQSVIDIQGEIDAASGASADALTNQRIPKNLEKHVRAYYDQLNAKR